MSVTAILAWSRPPSGLRMRAPGGRADARPYVLSMLALLSLAQAPIPARIVSTSPSITETLFALGLGNRVVGVSTYCWFPVEVATRPKVGTFLKPNVEVIARLAPDLVFVHAGPHPTASQLAQLGIRTAVVDRGSLTSVFTTIRQIAAAVGANDRADRLLNEINRRLDSVRKAAAGRPATRFLIVVGRRPGTLTDIVGVGPGSYLDDLATLAGGVNVLAGTRVEYPKISLETIITLAPDVIVDVGEMGELPATSDRRRAMTEELWRGQTLVKAVRERRIYAVDDQAFVVPGPRLVEVAETMALWFKDTP